MQQGLTLALAQELPKGMAAVPLNPGVIDTDMLRPLPEPAGPISVGFAGRLLTDKGIRALVDAHRLLRAQGRDIRLLTTTIRPNLPVVVRSN